MLGAIPLLGSGLAWAQFEAQPAGEAGGSQAPNRPGAPLTPQLPAGGAASLAPLRPANDSLASPPPRRFDESLDNLVRQGVVTPAERSQILQGGGKQPRSAVVESSFVAINCAKLLIVQKPAYAPWGEWSRPDGGSSLEKLVVDRCASKSPLQ